MIVLFTDFGVAGPYTGQMKAVLHRDAPSLPVVDLLCDAPAYDAQASAYLLPALVAPLPASAVLLCVVDPGVGSERLPLIVTADERRFVGPDNGLFEMVVRRAERASVERIAWKPPGLSASFHGRDLFAPVAARLAAGKPVDRAAMCLDEMQRPAWPDDLAEVVYVDGYGNAMTGTRARSLDPETRLSVAGRTLARARTFADVAVGAPFWYENAHGLAEIAVNQGRAADLLGLGIGTPVDFVPPSSRLLKNATD